MDRTLIVLTGVAGAGKTAVVTAIHAAGLAKQLKPFTTRPKRNPDEDEYHFLADPPAEAGTAWIIKRPPHQYGMLKSELEGVAVSELAITVFDPNQLDVLKRYRDLNPGQDIVIIGLDTISNEEEQLERVGRDQTRTQRQQEIDAIRKIIAKQDVTLTGDEATVIDATLAVCRILSSRGGVVTRDLLRPLLVAGTLLKDHELRNLESASYDLRVGDEVWCQGKFQDLSLQNPIFEVPPYSYAIVKAKEIAMLPSFIVGQFDIKVSHFLSGIILSNGPQVDPGYRGELFCMLFNGSSVARNLRMDEHFSTIHFMTTTRNGEPYGGQYSLAERLRKHMPLEAATGPGGAIFSRIENDIKAAKTELRSEMPKDRLGLFSILFTVVTAVALTAAAWAVTAGMDANKAALEARSAVKDLSGNRETKAVRPSSADVRITGETTSSSSAPPDGDRAQRPRQHPASENSSQPNEGTEGPQPSK